ncbi:mycofactocin biosynthesis glycosyltransferase MftF [Streptomyces sp. NPDC102340]|uniref:mycofactocin biosynthesis glycosyltransferase MftF n=1 Tax=unclassified Streptomyces TaxID=2593676 RepID=UPI0038297B7D
MTASPASFRLSTGSVAQLCVHVREFDEGRVLVGGSPPRLVRLARRARPLLRERRISLDDPASARLADRLVSLGMAHPVVGQLPPVEVSQVTVVVPVRDRAAQLGRLLGALGGQLPSVLVVDDASRDREAVARVAARHGADLVRLDVNGGPAAARNEGLRHVRTPYVAFVDSDVVVAPAALATLLRHFHDPRLAAVAPRVLGLTASGADTGAGPSAAWISRYEAARSSLDLGPWPALVRQGSRVSWVPSACLVARVAAIRPGFDASMRVGEDVDLVWRLARAGHRVRYEPAVTARHDHRTRLRDWLGRKAYYGTGAHALQKRHGAAIAPAALTPWAAATALTVLAQRRWSVPVAATVLAAVTWGYARKATAGTEHPYRTALNLTGLGVAGTAEQTAALLLRHWWPVTAVGCLVSRRVRRAAVAAAVVDGIVEYRRLAPDLDPVRFTLARRLDDLAYGAGVWVGAARGRSVRCLLPRIHRRGGQ